MGRRGWSDASGRKALLMPFEAQKAGTNLLVWISHTNGASLSPSLLSSPGDSLRKHFSHGEGEWLSWVQIRSDRVLTFGLL